MTTRLDVSAAEETTKKRLINQEASSMEKNGTESGPRLYNTFSALSGKLLA